MPYIITAVITLLVALPLGIFVGIAYRRRIAEAEIGSAEEQAKKILEDGIKAAETKKKEALIEAKEEIFKQRTTSTAKSRTDATSFPIRNAALPQRKNRSTARVTISRKRKSSSQRRYARTKN